MKLGLENKVVVVTGGSQGIGQACAEVFAQEGAIVVICGRSQEKIDSAVLRAREKGLTLYGRAADVTAPESFSALLSWVWETFGALHVLVNNAGLGSAGPLLSLDRETWQRIVDTNLTAVWSCSQIAVPYLEKNGGVILNMSSLSGRIAFTNQGVYSVTKAGINALTRVLASETAAKGIRVLAVAPGFTETDMIKKHGDSRRLTDLTLLRRLAKTEEVGKLVAFLASDLAAYMTAEVVEISGGAFRVRDPGYSWDRANTSGP